MNKKILICTGQYSVGGVSRVVDVLARTMSSFGHRIDILAPSFSNRGHVEIRVPSVWMPGLLGSIPFWETGLRMAQKKKEEYDAIFLHHPMLLSGECLNIGQNSVVTFHNTYYGYAAAQRLYQFGRYGSYYDLAANLERRFLQNLSDQPGVIVTGVSPFVQTELHANGYSGESGFIPNGIPEPKGVVDRVSARETLNRLVNLGLNPEDVVVIYVGSDKNMASKRPLLVPSFFEEFPRNTDNVKLLMVGDGFGGLGFGRKNKTDSILCPGLVGPSLLHLLYSCADAYISLSCYEGLPNSVLEATSYGLPMILSDVPVHRWVLSEGLGSGILVDSFNPCEDADKAYSFLLSVAGSRSYPSSAKTSRFSWERIAQDYLRAARIDEVSCC